MVGVVGRTVIVGRAVAVVPRAVLVVPVATRRESVVTVPAVVRVRVRVVAVATDRLHVNVVAEARSLTPALGQSTEHVVDTMAAEATAASPGVVRRAPRVRWVGAAAVRPAVLAGMVGRTVVVGAVRVVVPRAVLVVPVTTRRPAVVAVPTVAVAAPRVVVGGKHHEVVVRAHVAALAGAVADGAVRGVAALDRRRAEVLVRREHVAEEAGEEVGRAASATLAARVDEALAGMVRRAVVVDVAEVAVPGAVLVVPVAATPVRAVVAVPAVGTMAVRVLAIGAELEHVGELAHACTLALALVDGGVHVVVAVAAEAQRVAADALVVRRPAEALPAPAVLEDVASVARAAVVVLAARALADER